MEQNENTLDNLWPISSCPGFLNDLRDPDSAKLNYRLLFGKPWQAIRDAYQWILPNQKCRHKVNQWISNEFPIRCTTLTKSPGDSINCWEAKIGEGVYILYSPKIPSSNLQDLENPDWSVFYINLIWRDAVEYKGENALWAGRRFLEHLHVMPGNPIQAVYMRTVNVSRDLDCQHLVEALNIIPSSRATVERLEKVYRKAIGTTPIKQLDVKNKPYHRVVWWNPKSRLELKEKFKWPNLLKDHL